ncbi:MAG: glycosyltransferase family 2 protein [Vampirovibrionales bacterium]
MSHPSSLLPRSCTVVIPMAGAGSRFAQAGYTKPKPFIEVLGKPMICHVLENLKLDHAHYILIAREAHLKEEAETVHWIKTHYPVTFITVEALTEGAACTVLFAHRHIPHDAPLLIANSDQLVDIDIATYVQDCHTRALDGSILTFHDDDPKWSYAALDAQGHVTHVREKEVISTHATVGIYYFSQGRTFIESALDMMIRNDRVNGEFYVCPAYNYAIASGATIGVYPIPQSAMHGTGTPADLDAYIALKTS